MPELPEVETTVRALAQLMEGERITHVQLNRPDLRRPFPPELRQSLTGARITSLGRRAKYGLIHTDRAQTMVFHLGMSGRWRIDPEAEAPHDHLLLSTAKHRFALYDPRRFGSVDLVATKALDDWGPLAHMGPEPLGDALSAAGLHQALKGRKASIKSMLLDQRIIAGLGNIYVCEALFRAHIDPRKAAGKVSLAALKHLVRAIRDVLTQSLRDGGSTLRDYQRPNGELGYFATQFMVYGREDEPCLNQDGGMIRRITQGGRSTWFCPRCQR